MKENTTSREEMSTRKCHQHTTLHKHNNTTNKLVKRLKSQELEVRL